MKNTTDFLPVNYLKTHDYLLIDNYRKVKLFKKPYNYTHCVPCYMYICILRCHIIIIFLNIAFQGEKRSTFFFF